MLFCGRAIDEMIRASEAIKRLVSLEWGYFSNVRNMNFCKTIGHEELLDDPEMATPHSRFEHRERLNEIIAEWTARHTKQEATDILARAGVPAGALLDIDDIAHDPQYTESGIVVEVEHPYRGKLKMPGFAARMSENHIEYQCSPELGGDNEEIYGGLLGLSEDELAVLKEKNVI